ncbi:MAG: hypothetical protein ABR567_15725 [Myxococcales bacterium]
MRFVRMCACGALIAAACGGRRDAPLVSMTISPATATVDQGGTQAFVAQVVGADLPVAWSLAEGPTAGSIAGDGTYSAPPAPGSYHVVGRAGPATATAVVTIPPITVSISPASADVLAGGSVQLQSNVSGAVDRTVRWSASAGSVDATGLYTAPLGPGIAYVVATSRADPSRSFSAAINVVTQRALSIDPPIAALEPGASLRFNPTVAASWSADGGTIDADGLYVAPQTPGWYHVTAVALGDGSQRATAQVYVEPRVTVAIAPASPRLETGAQQQFVAAAAGSDPGVTWTVQEPVGGTIDPTGLYTAPRAAGAYHVVATSVADPSRSASTEITVAVPPVSVILSPAAITVKPGASLTFKGVAAGAQDTRLHWSSNCCKAIAQDGTFTAPLWPGAYHLIARSVADPSQFASATITVQSDAPIDPSAVTLAAGDRIAFTSSDPSAIWSLQEGARGGTISNGVYQAPSDHGGSFHVVASGRFGTTIAQVDVLPADLVDHGGTVVPTTRTFAIFWGDPNGWPADVRPAQEAILRGLAGSAYLRLGDEYLRGATGGTSFGGTFTIPSNPPGSPDKADNQTVGAVACEALKAGGVTVAPGDVAIVYGSAQLSPAPSWCAWHSYFTCGGTTLLIAFIPNVAGPYGCVKLGANAGCNLLSEDANATGSLAAHELLEAMTDPLLSAWTDAAGGEIGDKCEEQTRCIALSTGSFQLQTEYSNAIHACVP